MKFTSVALMLLGVLAACSPALNWREVRSDGAPALALMPCKPERATRDVPLLGPAAPQLSLNMTSCEADGSTYALGVVKLPDESTALSAVQTWRSATWASLKQASSGGAAPPGWQQTTTQVPASQAGQLAESWEGPGLSHNGQPLQARVLWVRKGPWLMQAAAYAPAPASGMPLAWATFVESLRIQP